MSNYTALWIDNTGVGCALWKGDLPSDGAWYGQWTGYFIKVGVRGPGGPLYIEWESVSGWMVVTKSELTSNGLMNGNYIKGISVWSSSNHNTYPSTQPTLKYGFS